DMPTHLALRQAPAAIAIDHDVGAVVHSGGVPADRALEVKPGLRLQRHGEAVLANRVAHLDVAGSLLEQSRQRHVDLARAQPLGVEDGGAGYDLSHERTSLA